MKKILALALALLMTLFVCAMAEEPSEAEAPSATHADVTVQKEYTITGGDGKTIPSETLTFKVEAKAGNPDDSMITVDSIDTSKTLDITIKFPTYTKMGVYTYTVSEDKGDTLGVTYDETAIQVIVSVTNTQPGGENTTDELLVNVAINSLTEDGEVEEKITGDGEGSGAAAYTNEFAMGQLTVSKEVTGNLASNTKPFTINVEFTGGTKAGNPITVTLADGTTETLEFDESGKVTKAIDLKHGDSATFTNIPDGIEYTVVESETHTTGELNSEEGYTATYANSDNEETGSGSGAIAGGDKDTVKITNEKKTTVETGITLETLPYVLVVALVLAGAALMIVRRRRNNED